MSFANGTAPCVAQYRTTPVVGAHSWLECVRYLRAPSQQVLPEIDYGMLDEPPRDYEPPGDEEFVMPTGPAATARSLDTDRVSTSVAFNVS